MTPTGRIELYQKITATAFQYHSADYRPVDKTICISSKLMLLAYESSYVFVTLPHELISKGFLDPERATTARVWYEVPVDMLDLILSEHKVIFLTSPNALVREVGKIVMEALTK